MQLLLLQPQTNVSDPLTARTSDPGLALFPASPNTVGSRLPFSLAMQCTLNDPVGVHGDVDPASLSSSFTTGPHCVAKVKPRLN